MIECLCMDNLDLMKSIESEKIDLIYCDMLYGTGRNFKDYKDLKPIRSEIENHYIPRLNEMKRVLKDTGSIYLQIDCNINHWIRCMMDDIFGYNNFLNEIICGYKWGGTSKNKYPRKHDNILFYSKTKKYIFNIQYEKYTTKDIRWHNNSYGKSIRDVWDDISIINTMSKERIGYPTQKPKALIERIIKSSSNELDLVADFYMGSGTTAEVCKELNRNFIGCDINKRAVDISIERVQKIKK